MAMLLTKMSMQNVDFCKYSPSVVVIASFYAATAFLKHSKKYEGVQTSLFCSEVRKLIFQLLNREHQQQKTSAFREAGFMSKLIAQSPNAETLIQNYQMQFSQANIEHIAMSLVDFYKVFNDWHCGLNQLRKFNKAPIE